jgi:hypothetical protein
MFDRLIKTIAIKWHYYTHQLKKLLHIIPPTPPIPPEDVKVLKQVYLTTAAEVAIIAAQATRFQRNISEAKTKHKRDLYERKFNKIRPKFQDELIRLQQAKQILDDNGIIVEDSEHTALLEELGLAA